IRDPLVTGVQTCALPIFPGVEAAEAASTSGFPVTPVPSFYNVRLAVADRAADSSREWPYAELSFATPGYFRAMGIPLLKGRTFRSEERRGGAECTWSG